MKQYADGGSKGSDLATKFKTQKMYRKRFLYRTATREKHDQDL